MARSKCRELVSCLLQPSVRNSCFAKHTKEWRGLPIEGHAFSINRGARAFDADAELSRIETARFARIQLPVDRK